MGTITQRIIYDTPIPDPLPELPPRRSRAEQARINGAKSRGPKSDEGKAKVSQNARKHGLAAKLLLVDTEHEAGYNEIEKGLANSFKPQTEAEDLLIEQIAKITWKLRQADNMEMDLLRDNIEQGDSIHSAFSYDPTSLMLLSTYQARLARQMHKLFAELRKVQTETVHLMREVVSLRAANQPILELQSTSSEPRRTTQNQDSSRESQEKICKNKPKSEPEPPQSKPEQTRAHSEECPAQAREPHSVDPPPPERPAREESGVRSRSLAGARRDEPMGAKSPSP